MRCSLITNPSHQESCSLKLPFTCDLPLLPVLTPAPPPPADADSEGIVTIFDDELNQPFEDVSFDATVDFTFPVLENGKKRDRQWRCVMTTATIMMMMIVLKKAVLRGLHCTALHFSDRLSTFLASALSGVPNTAIRVELPSPSAFRLSVDPQQPPITLETLQGASINFRFGHTHTKRENQIENSVLYSTLLCSTLWAQ